MTHAAVSEACLSDDILLSLEHLVREQTIPMILLAQAHHHTFESLREHVTILPMLSRTLLNREELLAAIEVSMGMSFPLSGSVLRFVQHWQREHLHSSLIQAEQAWITTRRTWLSQRQEWLTGRREWLCQLLVWLEQQRKLPAPPTRMVRGTADLGGAAVG